MSSRSAKKNKNVRPSAAAAAAAAAPSSSAERLISPRGKKLLIAGAVLVVAGFVVLTRTDPAGQNWASLLSPFLLVLGYALFGFGLLRPSPPPTPSGPVL